MPALTAPILARLRAVRLLEPLAERDFALLTTGSVVSLLGDGFFSVALAWQVYEISNVQTALSVVGVAWTIPVVAFILLGGVLSDRYDRRWLMIGADIVRALAIGMMGMLSLGGVLELWHILVLIAFVGLGDAFFNPASTAIVPDLLPARLLPQANALNGLVRPLMVRLAGPALAGFVLPGSDPARPSWSTAAHSCCRPWRSRGSVFDRFAVRSTMPPPDTDRGSGEFCLRASPSLHLGHPARRHVQPPRLHRSGAGAVAVPAQESAPARSRGARFIFAISGVGSILAALGIGQFGLPRRRITVMYATCSAGVALLAGYGLMDDLWQTLLIGFATAALFEIGQIIWTTLLNNSFPASCSVGSRPRLAVLHRPRPALLRAHRTDRRCAGSRPDHLRPAWWAPC